MNWEYMNIIHDGVEAVTKVLETATNLFQDNHMSFDKINDLDAEDSNTLCRLCARSAIDPAHTHSELDETLKLATKINCFFGIQNTDFRPTQLCNSCNEKMDCDNSFGRQGISADTTLLGILDSSKSNDHKLIYDDRFILNPDSPLVAIIDENLDEECHHGINGASHDEEKISIHPESDTLITNQERKSMTFQCFENDHQYLECMTLFRDEASTDDHKFTLVSNTPAQPHKRSTSNVTFSLGKRFNFQQKLHEEDILNCNIDNLDSNREQELFHHYKRYYCDSTAVSCLQCGKLFDNQSQLRVHVCIDGKIRQHICEVCNKGFTDGYTLKRHVVTHLPEKPFKCNLCTKSFTQKSRLNKHIAGHEITNDETQICWRCLECAKLFPSCEEADEHYQCHENVIKLIQEMSVQRIFHCEFCNNFFADTQTLKTHQSGHLANKLFNCAICKIGFKSFTEAVIHWKGHPRVFKLQTVFICDVCEKDTKDLTLLYKHKRKRQHFTPKKSASGEEMLYACERCGDMFVELDDMICHSKTVCSKFPCSICGSHLPTANSLEAHKRRHNGLRPYVCNICGKSYTQSSHMWTHKRFHMGVKPYGCQYCDQKFTIKPDLADHIRKKHTRERPFKCEVCNKAFLTGSVYYQHRLIHREDRRYKCNFCQKTFTRTEALNNHVRIHTGEKPHACGICGRCFRQKGDMRKHRRTQHDTHDNKSASNGKIVADLEKIVGVMDVR